MQTAQRLFRQTFNEERDVTSHPFQQPIQTVRHQLFQWFYQHVLKQSRTLLSWWLRVCFTTNPAARGILINWYRRLIRADRTLYERSVLAEQRLRSLKCHFNHLFPALKYIFFMSQKGWPPLNTS